MIPENRQFDPEERLICAAFSEIQVNPTGLAAGVRGRMNETNPRRVPRVRGLLAVAMVLLLVSTAAVAVGLYGFDRFMERFQPPFAELVEPIGLYAEDEGIRFTVIGAQQFGNMALVYLSVQDVSGADRLTESMDFLDGFRIWSDGSAGLSWRQTLLDFDAFTNTAYFEFRTVVAAGELWIGPLEIGATRISLETYMFRGYPMDLSLAGLREAATVPFAEEYVWTAGGTHWDVHALPTRILAPGSAGSFAPMPHNSPLQWISNIGIIDGQLHVQYAGCYEARGQGLAPGDASFDLLSPEGEVVWATQAFSFVTDENFAPRTRDEWWNDDIEARYWVREHVFAVDLDRLADYTLLYTGLAQRNILGNWRVAVDTSDTSHQMIALTTDISVDGFLLEFITLSPLGLEIRGSSYASAGYVPGLEVYLETMTDMILMDGGGGFYIPPEQRFSRDWQFDEPFDIGAVVAIVINGWRIPLA
ncbi:MAG: hypothetical protein FWD84_03465 [Oscillospiraceae bacterium]|nr:hypothetical protein [Oscillospiraceae bacterium]